jgi:hypothetical protein
MKIALRVRSSESGISEPCRCEVSLAVKTQPDSLCWELKVQGTDLFNVEVFKLVLELASPLMWFYENEN